MTITTRDQLIDALANNSDRVVIDKASLSNTAAGQLHSLWRATGTPGQAAIPAAAALCNSALLGALGFTNQTAPATSYLGWAALACSNGATTLEIHDRLGHMGGLSGTSTAAQTVNLDVSSAGLNVPAGRLGDSNFSDVQWFAEWYTDTGSTAVTLTVNVTYGDDTSGNLTGISLAATRRASFLVPLTGYIPAASSGKKIKKINTATLSATTGTAGSWGFTASRLRSVMPLPVANKSEIFDWSGLGLPEVPNDACLWMLQLASTTTTGTVRGGGKIAHG